MTGLSIEEEIIGGTTSDSASFESNATDNRSLVRLFGRLGRLPFTGDDISAGSETELQAVVVGHRQSVDLPMLIEQSNYYANVERRIAAGETPRQAIASLGSFLNENSEGVWENSWVRLPERRLSPFALATFNDDLLARKHNPEFGRRADIDRFVCVEQGERIIRIPVSYLIKLSLAEVIGSQENLTKALRETGARLMSHFLNDNTSPETFSFYIVPVSASTGMGRALAKETAQRFLLSQLLVMHANEKLGLSASGQKALVYFAPHPPVRQKRLNDCISDAFYRELFMSPCLSGWECGEAKQSYMHLCHQVLSRSQLNAVAKLREAGVIANNLVVLPNLSNISLANNGTHVSLGSRQLTQLRRAGAAEFTAADEKYSGDLVIKIVEHFLPLFVGAYTAAPYRINFADFHPERVLGFLPHELDYTHLRMMWRRWKEKADLKVLGHPVTPFGPKWLDDSISSVFRLHGDFVSDFRLVDYLACVMSTERSPGLDGSLGSGHRLKKDLADLGVFDSKMPLYLLYRLREYDVMGFTGYEGRHYSLFESLSDDMARAVDMQALITALAYKYIASGRVTHAHIPDDPSIESERRQIFFGSAIGISVFNVRRNSKNEFLNSILARTRKTRVSRRYPGFLRVSIADYRRALVEALLTDGADLVEQFNLKETIEDLQARLAEPGSHSAVGKLTRGILGHGAANRARPKQSPMKFEADEFNLAAERYYRTDLRLRHMSEALDYLAEDFRELEQSEPQLDEFSRRLLKNMSVGKNVIEWLNGIRPRLLSEAVSVAELQTLINLMLICIERNSKASAHHLSQ